MLLGKLMREARDTDVWEFTTVREVRARRRAFWRYLLDAWAAHGIA